MVVTLNHHNIQSKKKERRLAILYHHTSALSKSVFTVSVSPHSANLTTGAVKNIKKSFSSKNHGKSIKVDIIFEGA